MVENRLILLEIDKTGKLISTVEIAESSAFPGSDAEVYEYSIIKGKNIKTYNSRDY